MVKLSKKVDFEVHCMFTVILIHMHLQGALFLQCVRMVYVH